MDARLRTSDPSASVRAGAFSQYVLVQGAKLEDNLFLLPDALSFEDAVLIEAFSGGTHGKNVPQAKAEDHIVIYGAGPIGLCALSMPNHGSSRLYQRGHFRGDS
jgi:L-iditol 2-dehydrogenase